MKKKKSKDKERSRFLSLLLIVVIFTVAFIVLIKMQQNNVYYNMDDSNFSVVPEYGKTIVARDTNAIYPKYYVVNVDGDEYSIYVFNYYETESQYDLEFSRLIDNIVDYNIKDKMIRYLHSRGYGTYQEVLNNLSVLVDNENLLVY